MTLRTDVEFADGERVDADDVAFTYGLIADPRAAARQRGYTARLDPNAAPRVVDSTHLEWVFTEDYGRSTQLAHVGSVPILPAHILRYVEPQAVISHPSARVPLATGAFVVADHQPGVSLELRPNPRHADGRPHLDRVIFRVIPDYATRLHELRSGGVDVVAEIDLADVPALANHPDIRLYRRGLRSMDYVSWNLDKAMFADVRVRRAFAMAVDVQALVDELLTVQGVPYGRRAVSTVTPELCSTHASHIVPIAPDLDAAGALLDAAGWVDANGDGVREREGVPLAFPLLTTAGNARREAAGRRIAEMLAPLGVAVEVKPLEATELFHRLEKGDYEAAMAGWAAQLFMDPRAMWSTRGVSNFPRYSNADVDGLIERGLSVQDHEKEQRIWHKMQAQIYEDQPYLFLYWIEDVLAARDRVDGVHATVLSAFDSLHAWRIGP
jgi:peptide/nickel transport system substrate-binding protein